MRRRASPLALVAGALLLAGDAPASAARDSRIDAARDSRIDVYYVEPNVGTASAGHLAIGFGADVYHFQNAGDDTLQAARDRADFFRYVYSVLENRTVHVAHVAVDADTFELLDDRFGDRYRTERRHFATARALRSDAELTAALAAGSAGDAPRVALPGAGHFFPAGSGSDPVLAGLRERVRAERGARFLEERLAAIDAEIRGLRPSAADAGVLAIGPDAAPRPGTLFSERYAELASDRLAVLVLLRALPLREESVRRLPADALPLQPAERRSLARYAGHLEERAMALLDSRRPDRARPLLVALARRIAVERTLRTGRLTVLDAFPPDARVADGDALRARSAFLGELHARARSGLEDARVELARGGVLDERGYQAVEEAANRFLEYDEALRDRSAVRMESGRLVPSARPERAPLPRPAASREELAGALHAMRARERAYADRLTALYGYDLVARSCVTEIFRIVDEALGEDGSRERLGGHVAIGRSPRVLPTLAFAAVRDSYRVAELGEIPSLRRERLGAMYAEESDVVVYLRESNTLTSSIYRRNDRDSAFLFFTDDAVVPRPVFGALNLVAGLVEAASGLLRLPFDGGQSLVSGGVGALFSLPEIFFVNVRKGTLEYARGAEPRTRLRSAERP